MSTDGDSGPFRVMGAVITGFVVVFVFVLLAVQFGGADAGNVVSLPLVLVIPAVAALLWYRIKRSG